MLDDLILNVSKLYQPAVNPAIVVRPRLVQQLERGLQGAFTLVCAPAGYGKTTLVSSYLKGTSVGQQAAWLSLDEQDGDPAVFVRYCCAAVRMIFPEACQHTLALLRAPNPVPLAVLIATIGSEMADLPRDIVLVLDDYHAISGTAVPELLAGIGRHWPRTLHLVLITRRSPLLPLASLRAKGQLVEIRARDLQFTPAEATRYAAQVLGQAPPPAVLAGLLQQTEGWIAGLHLALLSWSGQADADTVTHLVARDANLAEYLLGELLGQQPAAIVAFMLRTSILDRFCMPLCEYAFVHGPEEPNSGECIEWLQRTNLLIGLDDRHGWYRYHHLLQEFLQLRAAAAFVRDQVDAWHHRAAEWFAAQGLVDEALHHALAAGDWGLAAKMMEQGLCAVLNRQDVATLRRWLDLLPEDFRNSRPGLQLMMGWLRNFSYQTDQLPTLLDRVETQLAHTAALPADELRLLRGQWLVLRAMALYFANQPAAAIACVQEALLLLPVEWSYVRGNCVFWLGVNAQRNGQAAVFGRILWARYRAAPAKGDSYALATLGGLCEMDFEGGRLEQVSEAAALMLEQSRRSGAVVMEGWARYWLGLVHYEWGDLATAAVHLHEVAHQRYSLHSYPARGGIIGLARLQCALCDLTNAGQTLALLHQYDLDTVGYEMAETAALRAELNYLQGDSPSALRWAAAFMQPVSDAPQPQAYNAHVVKGCLLLSAGTGDRIDEVQRLAASLAAAAGRTHNTRLQVGVLAMQALALQAQGCDL